MLRIVQDKDAMLNLSLALNYTERNMSWRGRGKYEILLSPLVPAGHEWKKGRSTGTNHETLEEKKS